MATDQEVSEILIQSELISDTVNESMREENITEACGVEELLKDSSDDDLVDIEEENNNLEVSQNYYHGTSGLVSTGVVESGMESESDTETRESNNNFQKSADEPCLTQLDGLDDESYDKEFGIYPSRHGKKRPLNSSS